MTLPIYPGRSLLKGLGYSQGWTPQFFNLPPAVAANGAEIDLALAQYPLDTFELTYNFLRDWGPDASPTPPPDSLEFKTMMGFWRQIGASVGRFLYKNIDDHHVAAQVIGTGDGSTTTFGPITRFFGAQGYGASDPVGQIDTAEPVIVRIGNVIQDPSTWSLNTAVPVQQTITFVTAPDVGMPIYMDFSFFYYCKFADDTLTFKKFMNRLWSLQKVTLKSCRAGA